MSACKECTWWTPKWGRDDPSGECRRHAPLPTVRVMLENSFQRASEPCWPRVEAEWRCGDWTKHEESDQ